MTQDVLDLLDELEEIVSTGYVDTWGLEQFIAQKRAEYEEPKGDCCG